MVVSKSEVEAVFRRFVESFGGRVAKAWNDVGAYELDYNSTYGGYLVHKIESSGGAVSTPFGASRSKPSEFVDKLRFATAAKEHANDPVIGQGWPGESKRHAEAARKGHLKRMGY